jgi:hypothetical protein
MLPAIVLIIVFAVISFACGYAAGKADEISVAEFRDMQVALAPQDHAVSMDDLLILLGSEGEQP